MYRREALGHWSNPAFIRCWHGSLPHAAYTMQAIWTKISND
jgi:hypothetical protein